MKKRSFKTAYAMLISVMVLSVFGFSSSIKKQKVSPVNIIPKPKEVHLEKGSFDLNAKTKAIVSNTEQKKALMLLNETLELNFNWTIETSTKAKKNYISFEIDPHLENESYELEIGKKGIRIRAKDLRGYVYAVQSLKQLFPIERLEHKKTIALPRLTIKDQPRFKWRGFMLDVSRHFFPFKDLKKLVKNLSLHKINKLHLHLIDDQGWRIEIKKYPKLTEVGAWRVDQEHITWRSRLKNKAGDKGSYGGFYTQEELKELVQYAAGFGIEIIPEIEMPAHVSSAVASYPFLSCDTVPIAVPSGKVWPNKDIYCAGKESTFTFLEDVIDEVVEIFPSPYIHIGGDEATKTNWEKCPHCQKRMREENLKDVEELQSYFIKRMQKYINLKGKKIIGWDEILEGGLAEGATVMSWRGTKGGLKAAQKGNPVIMTPSGFCYFNFYQGQQKLEPKAWGSYLPLNKVYQFDPVLENMTQDQANLVLGGQANLWSEYIADNQMIEYMVFPRIAALSEALWSEKEAKSWTDFSSRIQTLFKRYDKLGLNYAKSVYNIESKKTFDENDNSISIGLQNEFEDADIRYREIHSGDSSFKKYLKPFKINNNSVLEFQLFQNNLAYGKTFTDTISYHLGVGKKMVCNKKPHKNYPGSGTFTLANTIRGTKNFRDGNWLGWLNEDVELNINLKENKEIHRVQIGSMENQGSGIYYPNEIEIWGASEDQSFKKLSSFQRSYAHNGHIDLKTFVFPFEKQKMQYLKIKIKCQERNEKVKGAWVFIDEIILE